jgi:hypothetical protein
MPFFSRRAEPGCCGKKVEIGERKWAKMVENGEKWSKVVPRP